MNAAWNHIARSIFERPDVENVGLEELDYLLEEYPYFPVIHFLRTRKMLSDHLPESETGASRTALYFPNPHWLQYQLEGVRPSEQHELPLAEIMTTPSQAEELSAAIEEEQLLPTSELMQEETEMNFDDKRIFPGQESEVIEIAENDFHETEESFSEPAVIIEEDPVTTDIASAESDPPAIEVVEEVELRSDNEFGDSQDANEVAAEVDQPPVSEFSNEVNIQPAIEEVNTENPVLETNTEIEIAEPVQVIESNEAKPEETETPEVENVSMDAGTVKETEEESLEVPIEPLYTIDYFASQGIKLRQEEEMQNDKLSVKLRSFTEWLKAMKKIHPEKLDHKMGQEEENSIRVYAETSNEPKELYTEALAEVYLQQGLRQKATMVFEKLSLLDPSKSAYFAARIREIKEN